ncbi:hypothetical protein NQS96_01690 [Pseudoalteromonas shioyasakiensis]|uniref:hypothetical protein n=1 Tax=Pseudoalteromonas shioyasakiensis TaxID=1190813 RepID=UPI0021186805|nr:hypothetical protein [Pseudoalteromonas shioyasakiensis]MCQ8880513.1 hypothetical protein [Pseudoalteromonas shioyasakiensis]
MLIYFALFAKEVDLNEDSQDSTVMLFNFGLLGITPSVAYFYMEQFWFAVGMLSGVTILGLTLAKILESKGKRPLDIILTLRFVTSWLLIFGVIYWLVSLFTGSPEVQPIFADTDKQDEPFYQLFWPSVYYLGLMVFTLLLKVLEFRFQLKPALSGTLLILAAALIGISPLVDGSFILGLFINIAIFFIFCSMYMEINKINDPSGGAIAFFYAYILSMGIGLAIIVKIISVVFFSTSV